MPRATLSGRIQSCTQTDRGFSQDNLFLCRKKGTKWTQGDYFVNTINRHQQTVLRIPHLPFHNNKCHGSLGTLILLFQRCAAADNANDMGILGIQLLKPISAGMVQARCRAGGLCRCCSSAVQPAACDPTVPATCPTPLQWRPSCRKHRQVSAVDCKSDI